MSMTNPSRRKSRKSGGKAGRAAKNAAFQKQLRERKRARATRRALLDQARSNRANAGCDCTRDELAKHAPPAPVIAPYLYNKHFGRDELEANQMGLLRDIAKYKGVKVGRLRKADLIDAILAKQASA